MALTTPSRSSLREQGGDGSCKPSSMCALEVWNSLLLDVLEKPAKVEKEDKKISFLLLIMKCLEGCGKSQY